MTEPTRIDASAVLRDAANLDSFDATFDSTAPVDAEFSDSSSEGGSCGTVAQSTALATTSVVYGMPPAMTGGVIPDGIYDATSIVEYWWTDAGAPALPKAQYFAGKFEAGFYEGVESVTGTASDEERSSGSFSVSGNVLKMFQACPSVNPEAVRFSVSGTTLVVAEILPGSASVTTLQKR